MRGFLSRIPPVVRWTLITCVVVWLAYLVTPKADFWTLLMLHEDVLATRRLWQLVTYMALHSWFDPFHLLSNTFGLWVFGRDLERSWGSARFLRFMLVSGVAAGLAHVGLSRFVEGTVPVIGISGALFGVMVAFAMTWPRRKIWLLPIPVEVEARWLVIGYSVLTLAMAWHGPNGVANFAHLGGALAGWIQVRVGRAYYRGGFKMPAFAAKGGWLRRRRKRMRVVEDKDFDAWLKERDEDMRH